MWQTRTTKRDDGAVTVDAVYNNGGTLFSYSSIIKETGVDDFVAKAKDALNKFKSKQTDEDGIKSQIEAQLNK